MENLKLNIDQEKAMCEIIDFINTPTRKTHSLIGYAGTGKTTLINRIVKKIHKPFNQIIYSSPTHRANSVIKLKNPKANVQTLHSLLGLQVEQDLEDFDTKEVNFIKKNSTRIGTGDIVIIDEASMINDSLYKLIIKTLTLEGVKVLFIGDPEQIKPVKQKTPSLALTTTEKQSVLNIVERANNDVLLQESMYVRDKKDFSGTTDIKNDVGVSFFKDKNDFLTKALNYYKSKDFLENPLLLRVLASTNTEVSSSNTMLRNVIYNNPTEDYVTGDIIMGYSNWGIDYKTKQPLFCNSGDYIIYSVEAATKDICGLPFKGYSIVIKNLLNKNAKNIYTFILSKNTPQHKLEVIGEWYENKRISAINCSNYKIAARYWQELGDFKNSFMTPVDIKYKNLTKITKTLDYGYAHTIHKSQGGTYKYIFVITNNICKFKDVDLQGQLKYVALTRAEEGAFILQ